MVNHSTHKESLKGDGQMVDHHRLGFLLWLEWLTIPF
jgi:hypothetical protein